ncbi:MULTISPECIES: hypothetical protein [unclassified Streptomyces]|jgi:hypothetical protein|uniref:hypothetical protein n=1 Tax=unclassified Streptomyces TaxID=2593676 RepID=UPI000F5007A3|nr:MULTISPECIES: hypothetical protein [unclassified Streptomyces]MDH6454430.1 hypothetical protein [Streptomyces sp. SAI-119]MDH6495011.1 hypothetical protein [Streptomyces sp. SAI-149]QUC57866.1 hypothetical protein IOD14_14255 [Streptomyces sp. A2-16]
MHDSSMDQRAVGFLLDLIDADCAARIRRRIGAPPPGANRRRVACAVLRLTPVPSSVLVWILEQDDPELNAVVYGHGSADEPLRRAVLRGVPFGPGRKGPVSVDIALRKRAEEPPVPQSVVARGLVGALRAATAMGPARSAASMVLGHDDWRTVTAADRERPLPGYARWALSVRPDCPPELRAQFGSHPKFAHRVRQAGVLSGPGDYARAHGPAAHVLKVLSLGPALFPARVRAAEDALRPLVHAHLGDREEAWAVLAQLLDTFHGTAPELIMTAGAIA